MDDHNMPAGHQFCNAPDDERPVSFSVTLRDGATEEVVGADAYAQEQSMTTFFRTDGRRTVDCWAVRMASFRTDQIMAVRRHERRCDDRQVESAHDGLVTAG